MSLRKNLGAKIKSLRKKAGFTQEELSSAVNISPHFLSRIENGKESPSLATLERIAGILESPLYKFFKFRDKNDNPTKVSYNKKVKKILKSLNKKEKSLFVAEMDSLARNIRKYK